MSTYLEICVSPDRGDLLESLKQTALSNNLEYEESSHARVFNSIEGSIQTLSENIMFVTVVPAIASVLIKMQPTIQEIIKSNASRGITISCGEKKIEIKGNNDIENALIALQKLDCDSKS